MGHAKDQVIVMTVLENGMSAAEAARRHGVGCQWVHELLTRYAAEAA